MQLINVAFRSGSKASNILKNAPKKGITKKVVSGKIAEKVLDVSKKRRHKKEHNEQTKANDKKKISTTPCANGLSPLGRLKKFLLRR